jgi:hypothetical protein
MWSSVLHITHEDRFPFWSSAVLDIMTVRMLIGRLIEAKHYLVQLEQHSVDSFRWLRHPITFAARHPY